LSEFPEFKGHRHDQSLWSCLRKSTGTYITDIDETFPSMVFTQDFKTMEKYPFHATRIRPGLHHGKTAVDRIMAQLSAVDIRIRLLMRGSKPGYNRHNATT